jgi:hypothetical protein
VSEVTQEFPASLGAETLSYLTAQNGAWFSLIARSTSQSGVSARIRALVKVQGVQNGAVRIVSWDDNYVR